MPDLNPVRSKPSPRSQCARSLCMLLLAGSASLAGAQAVRLGTPGTPQSPSKPAETRKPVHHHRKTAEPVAQTTAPTPPPAPPMPKWPVNESPEQPKVQWDSQGLSIDASNSSLHQILNQVATLTGAKVEGFGTDERIFGDYGPGQARDVLSQLLHGTGYNVLMIGDEGQGTPRQIVLSPRHDVGNQPGANRPTPDNQDEDEQQPIIDEQQPMPPIINRGPINQPGPPRTPQQIMLEMQQRQQELQRQQQLQSNPPPQ